MRDIIIGLSFVAVATTVFAEAFDDVYVGLSGTCNGSYSTWIAKNGNRNRSIQANVKVSTTSLNGGGTAIQEQQVLLAPGGSQTLTCSGSPRGSAGGGYSARAELLGAEYK